MNGLSSFSWLDAPAWLPLVHALLHTIWQGALTAGGLLLALRFVPAHRTRRRYGLSAAALVLLILAGVGTWASMDPPRRSSTGMGRRDRPSTGGIARPWEGASPVEPAISLAQAENLATREANLAPATAGANAAGAKRWVPWAAAGWLLGASVCLLRAVKGTLGAGRLRRRCRELTDPRVRALAGQLCASLGVSRRVRFLVCDGIGVPSMLGILYPAVLLPASLLTGVPLDQLRAILAHELAHIRRWDYLVNLAQIVLEALLFFNPFVWWISRQMRLEREACCDEIAAAECASPATYVEALVAVIERGRGASSPTPILAANGSDPGRGSVLERARRLLVPGYQPVLRLRWYSLGLVLVLAGLALDTLWLGTRAVAQSIKTTEQKAAPRKADDPPGGPPGAASYQIKVVTADGLPLGDNLAVAYNHNQFVNSGDWAWHTVREDGLYMVNVPAGTVTESVAATKDGYAAVFAGPFQPQDMVRLNGLELKLTPGHAAAIETVDEAGRPVPAALLSVRYPGPPEVDYGERKTDAAGRATLEHLADAPLDARVRADGYQADEIKNLPLDPAKPYRWTLRKTTPLHGSVTAAATGQPIAGAVIRLAYAQGTTAEDHVMPGSGPVLATTDGQGGFTLASLRADSHYWFYVDAPGYGGAFVTDVTLAQGELKVALGPEVTIRGKVIHIPPTAVHDGKITLKYDQTFRTDPSKLSTATQSVELTPVNGEADFAVGPFYTAYPEVYTTTPNPGGSMRWWHNSVSLVVGDLPPAYYIPGDPLPASFVLDLAQKPADTPAAASPTTDSPPDVPNDVLAAAREGNAKQALRLLEVSAKPKKLGEDEIARILDELIRARELRAFTTLYDALRHSYAEKWKLRDEQLAALVKDGRTDFLDALIARRFDLDRLTKAAASADPATAAWITRRTVEVARQRADGEALEKAAADNDLPAMQRLVEEGADINGVGRGDNTPLIRAVFKNRLEAARWLLDHGAQVDKPRLPGWNYTPLCLVNSVPMAELLKERGADVHAKLYERDVSILTYVVDFAKADVVAWFLKQGLDANMIGDNQENLLFGLRDGATAEVLLEAGADPNRVNEFGYTPLSAAESAEVMRALVRHGANLKPKLKDGMTLLEFAVLSIQRADDTPQEQADRIEELIRQGAEFDPKGNGVRATIATAFHDRVGEVRAFLDHGVSPNAAYTRGSDGYQSALGQAAMQAPKSLKLLLERGADPNAPVPADGWTPLELALGSGAFGNVDLLRQAGAKGLSDLAYFSAKGDVAKVSEMLAAHADPNEAGSSGWTPLIYAIKHAQVEVAKRLLDAGASVDQFDGHGFSPYLYFLSDQSAIEYNPRQAQVQWHLSESEAKVRLAAFERLFAQHPPNFAYRNREGRTALHQAAWAGNSLIVGRMLEGRPSLRFDPNLPDREGRPPLLLAALSPVAHDTREIITTNPDTPEEKIWNEQAHFVNELLQAGARLDIVVADGKTVGELALAAARDAGNAQLVAVLEDAAQKAKPGPGTASPTPTPSTTPDNPAPAKHAALAPKPPPNGGALRNAAGEGRIGTVRGLLDHGANINYQDEQGFTPLSWAGYCGQEDVCLLLLERGADGRIEDEDGRNAAWHAAAGPHCAEALARMIKGGVPITGKDKQGNIILDYVMSFGAPRVGDGEFPNKVYSAADINRYDESERRVVELLLAQGLDPNGGGGDVPLIRAMHNRHYAAVRVLLAHGADPAREDKDGNTALYEFISYAVDRPLPLDLFKTLWRRSGSLNPELTVLGVTPPEKTTLLEMILDGAGGIDGAGPEPVQRPSFREAIKVMLDGGMTFAGLADANSQALLQAAARGDLAAVQRSVGQGAAVSVADDRGWDALSLTTALGYSDCAVWLIDHGADVNGHHRGPWNAPLPRAISGGQAELVEKLLAKGATLDGVYRGLYTAVRLKNTRVFEALLKAGADPKEKPMVTVSYGSKTFTPHDSVMLFLCIENGQTDVARTLLDRGADADPPNLEDGRNLAWWAVDYNRPEILHALLDHGANPLTKDDHGESALDLAQKYHPKLVPIFEEAAKRPSAPAISPPPAPAA